MCNANTAFRRFEPASFCTFARVVFCVPEITNNLKLSSFSSLRPPKPEAVSKFCSSDAHCAYRRPHKHMKLTSFSSRRPRRIESGGFRGFPTLQTVVFFVPETS